MKKNLFMLFITIIMITTGCNSIENSQETKETQRIISLIPSNTEILYELGVYKEIIGVSTSDNYPQQVKDKEKFDGMKLDYESILRAKPTMIFAHESMEKAQEKTLKKLRSKGIKVVVVNDATSFEGLYESIEQIAVATGKQAEGKALIEDLKKQVKEIAIKYQKHVKDKRILIEVSSNPDIYTGGNHTLMNDLLKQLGAVNIFSGIEGYQAVSMEAIVKSNPDIILSTSEISNQDLMKEVKSRNGFSKVKAVKNNQIHAVNADLVSRPGPRIAQGMEEIAKVIAHEK
ncbi:heme/hemin ABC transporter substrate-binding protein [Macrococcus animalis]|uniref:heme/hemin ABC transporter substrate-binding protein n=1 Tax=Macrococcus animalis TaxID=3395467 RepID=UPI0039BDAFF2